MTSAVIVSSSSLSSMAERDSISSMATITGSNYSPSSAGSESLSRVGGTSGRPGKRKGSEWEILGNLEKGVSYTIKPKRHEGWLSKRRKWPLKGWHKRYYVIEQGFFAYGKNAADMGRGRTLGRFNIGEAVISANYAEMRIDIDAEESVHHVKFDSMEQFGLFLEQMQQHRLFVQHQTNCGVNSLASPTSPEDSSSSSPMGPPSINLGSHRNSLVRGVRPARANLLAEMSQQDESLVNNLQQISSQLGVLMDCLSKVEGEHSSSGVKKLFHLRKKKSSGPSSRGGQSSTGSDRASPVEGEGDLISSSSLAGMSSLSNSNPSLASLSLGRPISFPGAEGCGKGLGGGKEEALTIAIEMQGDLANIRKDYLQKRDHIKMLVESDSKGSSMQPNMAVLASLRQALRSTQEQNQVLRTRLARINAESDISEMPAAPAMPETSTLPRGMNGTLSYSSSCMSEFFDAREYADSEDTDDEEEELSDEESRSETEEDDAMFQEAVTSRDQSPVEGDLVKTGLLSQGDTGTLTGRRRELPVPKTDTEGVNLWNLLCKNIGKDLSKISMPVTLNEPLSTLQRLCEELEYSDLVDKAVSSSTPLERMTWVAAFAISAYGSTRASHKPFNPLLGETYECVREDKGFRYISEQVSHHPPVSCVHASGTGWVWSQALRIRSKFWGKSMEFQPEGSVHLSLQGHGEEYKWNKVTSCIHNLLGQERWVDLYGESLITCKQSGLTARIQFVKASYWSNKRHELFGTITDNTGAVLQNMFGKWSEALYVGKAPSARCIWRPGSLPEEAELYYGFSRLAVELNEVTSIERSKIPPTDARLRPDQKALEEGRVAEAENIKLGVEQAQRDRRRQRENDQLEPYKPLWFVCSEVEETEEKVQGEEVGPERWKFGDTYWDSRNNSFLGVQFEPLW